MQSVSIEAMDGNDAVLRELSVHEMINSNDFTLLMGNRPHSISGFSGQYSSRIPNTCFFSEDSMAGMPSKMWHCVVKVMFASFLGT